MKSYKILQLSLSLVVVCLLVSFTGCGNTSSQTQQEPFWEGRVRPGTYTGNYNEDNGMCYNRYQITITIYEDETAKFKEVLNSSCGSGAPKIRVCYGALDKYVETYNGQRKVWYSVIGKSDDGWESTSFNLSTSMEYSPGQRSTYQDYMARPKLCTLH